MIGYGEWLLRKDVIDTTGETVSEETIPPPLRERTPDVPPEVTAKARYRENYAKVFGGPEPRLPGNVSECSEFASADNPDWCNIVECPNCGGKAAP